MKNDCKCLMSFEKSTLKAIHNDDNMTDSKNIIDRIPLIDSTDINQEI